MRRFVRIARSSRGRRADSLNSRAGQRKGYGHGFLHEIVENDGGGDRYDGGCNASSKKYTHDLPPASVIERIFNGWPIRAQAYPGSWNASVSISTKVRPSAPTRA